jgi:hypothetical protein
MEIHFTSGHHPEANGQVERLNQSLEQYIRHYCNYQQTNWFELLPIAEFTYNNTPHDSTGISPFFANKGYNPSIRVYPEKDIASVRARDLAVDISQLQEILKERLRDAQERYTESANRRRQPPPTFSVGDRVYVLAEHISTTRPQRKLAEKFLGPYKVIAKPSSQSYTIELPQSMRTVHPVFHVSQLEPYVEDQFPGRRQPTPEPVQVDGEQEWEVSEILDSKYDRRFRKCPLRYLVKWIGFEGTHQETEWTAASDCEHAKEAVKDFHVLNPNCTGSYQEFLSYIPDT